MNYLSSFLLLVLICTSCSKPSAATSTYAKYWVPGLSLPAGSSVVDQTELIGPKVSTLSVHFENQDGWTKIGQELEASLKASGFSETALPPGLEDPYLLQFSKRGTPWYMVAISDNSKLIAIQKARGKKPATQFTLTVSRFESRK